MARVFFLDIDGCIFKHKGRGSCAQWYEDAECLPGAREFLERIEKESATIILTTSRPESNRRLLAYELERHCIFYDLLIMGLPHGERVIVNDSSVRAVKFERNNPEWSLVDGARSVDWNRW